MPAKHILETEGSTECSSTVGHLPAPRVPLLMYGENFNCHLQLIKSLQREQDRHGAGCQGRTGQIRSRAAHGGGWVGGERCFLVLPPQTSPAATLRDPSNQLGCLVFILTGFHLSRVGRGACRIVQWKLSLSCLEQVQTINI